MTRIAAVLFIGMLLIPLPMVAAGGRHEVHWKFPPKARVEITARGGACVVRQGSAEGIAVDISSTFKPAGSFVPSFIETTGSLLLEEQITGPAAGGATWTLTLPAGTEVRFRGDSGDFSLSHAAVSANVTTRSGSVRLLDATGAFSLYSESGLIDARGITVTAASELGTASGSVSLLLAASPRDDLFLSARSGTASVNYGGNPPAGRFHLEAEAAEGEISSGFGFDTRVQVDRNGVAYTVGDLRRENDTPRVRILTRSGKAALLAR
jgi:hypothetical protein